MRIRAFIVTVFISFFVMQSIAEAASISTRVRILESKVYKQNKQIDKQEKHNKAQDVRLEKGLKKIETLKYEVETFIRQTEIAKKKKSIEDKNYAFP